MIKKHLFEIEIIELPKKEDLTYKKILGFIGSIASVCSGKNYPQDSEEAIRVGEKTLSEAAGFSPSKVWEYWPTSKGKFGNARSMIKEKFDYYKYNEIVQEDLIKYYEPEDFFIFKCRAINMIWYQVSTHRLLSPLKQSLRYLPFDRERIYRLPEIEIGDKVIRKKIEEDMDDMSPYTLRMVLKNFYKRKEIYNRDHNNFEMVEFYICGKYPKDWQNFFDERLSKKAQKETREFAEALYNIIKKIVY